MPIEHLTQSARIVEAITEAGGVAGTADINGAIVDMAGFDAIAFLVVFGAIAGGAVTSIKMQRDDAANMASAADIADSGQTVAVADNGKTFISDLYFPGKRYVRGVVDRGTANATVRAAFYILYGARTPPAGAQGSTVVVEQLKDRGEGTA